LGIGHYMVVEGAGVLTDAAGKPVGNEKHCLSPGEDARLVACRLLRKRQSAGTSSLSGFDRRIAYPRLGKI
jgi:hypothetical protein